MRVLRQTVCLSRHKPSGIPLLLEIEQCSTAEGEIDFLGAEVSGVGFTRDGRSGERWHALPIGHAHIGFTS